MSFISSLHSVYASEEKDFTFQLPALFPASQNNDTTHTENDDVSYGFKRLGIQYKSKEHSERKKLIESKGLAPVVNDAVPMNDNSAGLLKEECCTCGELMSVFDIPDLEIPRADYVRALQCCGNFWCFFCFHQNIKVNLKDTSMRVNCPSCSSLLTNADADLYGLSDYHSFFDNKLRRMLSAKTIRCPGKYPDGKACKELYEREEEIYMKPSPATCYACKSIICRGCMTYPFHAGKSCEEMVEEKERTFYINDVGMEKCKKLQLINTDKALCHCGIEIERAGGCEHITCQMCKAQFCYLCRETWGGGHQCQHNKCVVCQQRAVRIQVGTEHFICTDQLHPHEYCNECRNPWDDQHERTRSCSVNKS